MVCTKKFVQNKWTILGPKMAYPHNSGSALKIFLKFCRTKGAIRYMKISLVILWENFHLEQFDLFILFFTVWLSMVEIQPGHCFYWAPNIQDMISLTVRTWLGSLNSQEMISQVNIYVINIAWILCYFYLFRSEFNRGSDGFVKIL